MLRPISRLLRAFRRPGSAERNNGSEPRAFTKITQALKDIPLGPLRPVVAWANPRRLFRRKPRPAPIVRPYVDFRRPLRRIARFFFPIFLIFFCLIYGFFFALTAPYLILPFTVPILALVLMAIWALPDVPHAPTKSMEFCFVAVIISRVLWPNYLALELPGLPWITFLRLAGFPMAFLLLISLSTSAPFRAEISRTMRAVPGLLTCLTGFTLMGFLTIPLSEHAAQSVQPALLNLVYMVSMVLIGAWIGRVPGRVSRYIYLLLMLSAPMMLIALMETKVQKVLWVDNIPSFLKINDPAVLRMLGNGMRDGLFRTKATFSTPLGLSEYLAILTPFFIHLIVSSKKFLVRATCLLALPVSFFTILTTGARLGVVGFLASVLLYILMWGIVRFRRSRSDLVGATVVYGYPAIAMGSLGLILSVHKLRVMVLGGGETAASNQARQDQIHVGIPKILAMPLGHGLGESGNALGAITNDFVTIDNYYLTLGLDVGIPGILLFLCMFFIPIIYCVILIYKHPKLLRDPELSLILPLATSFAAFMIIKTVFSQQDSHMLLFAMLGMTAALASRIRESSAGLEAVAPTLTTSRRQAKAAQPGTINVAPLRGLVMKGPGRYRP